ncbi:MAG TPA: hypothetical protein VFI04_07670 [Gaiellaceae bacterium]|jgi:hypothetical protein|nr:hypothetical protein [Gaiellaceae bacterium]
MIVEREGYRLELAADGRRAVLTRPDGEHWLTLSLLASFDRTDARDESVSWQATADDATITIERRSTAWDRAGVTLTCGERSLELRAWVEGSGRLADVHLLGGRSLHGPKTGLFRTGTSCTTLFSAGADEPAKLLRGADEEVVLGVSGDGELGRGHWFLTPPPLFLAFRRDDEERWLGLGLEAPVERLRFVQAVHRPGDRAFHLVLEHEGHTAVDGRFEAPAVVLTPGLASPYDGVRAQAEPREPREQPAWWRGAIFCGWGAQCQLASTGLGRAPDLSTRANYDTFLAALGEHGVLPPTIVIDDKWQRTYGRNEPDEDKWPDLRGWIAARHDEGRRVLLWWKAWDPEGLPDELCVRRPDGAPVAVDPTAPGTAALMREVMHELLAPGGLDADGLKVDFTAQTPSGESLAVHGRAWGISLLHELLRLVYDGAKEAKPDALVITHTPHPAFADVTDMVRLNDMLRLDDPGPLRPGTVVPQMRHRAAVAAAAIPGVLVDTDDWTIPDLATWRDYLHAKLELGVPSLYYATRLDLTGEQLEEQDYAALRRVFGGVG